MPELMQRESVKPVPPVRFPDLAPRRVASALMYPVGSGRVRRGFVQFHPQTADRLGLAPADTIVLNQYGTAWPFRVERLAGVERGHVRLNDTDMDVMGICPGVVLTAHRVPQLAALPHNWPVERDRHDWLIPVEAS